jgi:hypothetical protein
LQLIRRKEKEQAYGSAFFAYDGLSKIGLNLESRSFHFNNDVGGAYAEPGNHLQPKVGLSLMVKK